MNMKRFIFVLSILIWLSGGVSAWCYSDDECGTFEECNVVSKQCELSEWKIIFGLFIVGAILFIVFKIVLKGFKEKKPKAVGIGVIGLVIIMLIIGIVFVGFKDKTSIHECVKSKDDPMELNAYASGCKYKFLGYNRFIEINVTVRSWGGAGNAMVTAEFISEGGKYPETKTVYIHESGAWGICPTEEVVHFLIDVDDYNTGNAECNGYAVPAR